MKNRKGDHTLEPFDRLLRGEISPVVAYESSLENIKDSLYARQYGQADSSTYAARKGAQASAAPLQGAAKEDEFSTHNPEAVYRLMTIISDIKTSMLTTIDRDGTLRSRPMVTQDSQDDGTLWFFSSDHHGKTDDLAADPRVNVTYSMPEKHRYISISGLAEVVHDETKKSELWNASVNEWLREPKRIAELVLLKVYIQKAEYWDVPSNRLVEMLSFTKAVLTGGTYHTAEPHQRITFENERF